jgi:eukaryotic-like serine/threonine-protein kinase
MKAEDYQKAKILFQSAIELSTAEREEFLSANCADDGLREMVNRLLDSHEKADEFIETKALNFASIDKTIDRNIPEKIGNYRILSELGEGGMGAVYLAERDDEQFKKQVAVKFIRRGFASPNALRRFRDERQILATLEHNGIARLLDGGETENNSPYLVMELVRGKSLKEFCTEKNLSVDDRLKLFIKICEAVAYAHQNLVIHRDLKPSNILVTDEGEPKLLDFGVSKMLSPETDTLETAPADRHLTPEYASPEQLRGDKVTTASDIYSLGVILYELLTDERPFKLANKNFAEIVREVTETEPTAPSRVSKKEVEKRRKGEGEIVGNQTNLAPSPPHPVAPSFLSEDLDNITLMALRKEPESRYQSAQALADDIRAYLDDLPISASTGNFNYYAGKFIKRNKLAVGASALILAAILFGIGATLWQANIARRQAKIAADERDKAQVAQSKAESINGFLQKMLSSAAPKNAGREVKIVEVLANAETQARTELAAKPEVLAAVLATIGSTYNNLAQHADAEKLLRSALEIYANLPEKTEQIAKSKALGTLADVFLAQNRAGESEPLVREAVEIQRRFQPETNRDLAINLIQLGRGILKKGDLETSEPLFNEGLTLARQADGEKSEVALFALNQLGVIAEKRGNLEKVEEIYRQIIPPLRENPQAKSNLATSLANLGDTLTELGKLTEAETFINEGLSLHRQIYGEENIYVAGSTAKLSRVRFAQKRYAEAQAEAEKSLAQIKKLLPPNAPISVLPLTVLGNSLTRQNQAQDGEKYLREALEIARKSNSSEWRIGIYEGYLGENLLAQKRTDEAQTLLTEGYQKVSKTVGAENAYALEINKNMVLLK